MSLVSWWFALKLDELLARLNPGDTLLVTELSRLGRCWRSTGRGRSVADAKDGVRAGRELFGGAHDVDGEVVGDEVGVV